MNKEVYKQLLEVMKKRRGPYAGMDIPEFYEMVEELFTPEEAEVNNAMPREPVTAKGMANEMGRNEVDIEKILESMADKGLCVSLKFDGATVYQSSRFFPGILDFQFMTGKSTERDKKLARLVYAYKKAFDAKQGPAKISFPATRVITVDSAIEPGNIVHTYDQVQTYIDKYDPIAVSTCYCRHAAVLRDEDTHGVPNDVCMQFGPLAQFAIDRLGSRNVTKQEAIKVLDQAEEAGLIHMSTNTTEDIALICNCDRWHCEAIQNVLSQIKPGFVFNSGFQPRVDPDICSACETCIDRCPASARSMNEDDVSEVDLERCFGCAVCATGCPSKAIVMESKPGFPEPPRDNKALREAIKAVASK